ncbi:MAG: cytochrome c-type biogenesis protein CcmH [Proteobacteria bacterium]|nr:MAG: cytochrome c-type biogenesis protein CcmH [Pseudomonadota bacterium]
MRLFMCNVEIFSHISYWFRTGMSRAASASVGIVLFGIALIGVLLVWSSTTLAIVETREFDNDEQRSRYLELVETLRCPKCQNQNIADSNAPISADMRKAVHKLVLQGRQSDEVVEYMVNRFGEFVVYKPRLDPSTYLLWFGPFLIGIVGFIFVVMMARKSRNRSTETPVLSSSDKSTLNNLLKEEK